MKKTRQNSGFTLIEVVLVIVIMGIIATVAMKTMQPAVNQSRIDATMREMNMLVNAITGDKDLISGGIRSDFGYVGDVGALPPDLDALVVNPGGYATWKGPYIMNSFVENADDYKKDAWGNAYVYNGGIVISSSGNGSPITVQLAGSVNNIVSNSVKGNVFDGLNAVPGDSASGVEIQIYYPDGVGGVTSATANPSASGQFIFSNMIPIGNHLVRAVYSSSADTASAYVTVLPGSEVFCELRFAKSYW